MEPDWRGVVTEMFGNRRRTSSEVMQEILLASPANKSNIRFSVGLNLTQVERYLPYLVSEGYLELIAGEKGTTLYGISPKGNEFLQILNDLTEMMGATQSLPDRRDARPDQAGDGDRAWN